MRAAVSSIAFGLGLASCVIINVPAPDAGPSPRLAAAPLVRAALSGQRQPLASFYATGSDCESLGYPTLKVAKAPQHGVNARRRDPSRRNPCL